MLDISSVRKEFPILGKKIRGKPLCYLDNGASAQKPKVVIDTIKKAMSLNMLTYIEAFISYQI